MTIMTTPYIPSHPNVNPILSIFSSPSTELIPIHRNDTTSIESTYAETEFLSIHYTLIPFETSNHSQVHYFNLERMHSLSLCIIHR